MAHSVTITRTTTTSMSSTAIILNTGYLTTVPGILKVLQTALNATCVGLVANNMYDYRGYGHTQELFFLLIATTFLIVTAILLISCLASIWTVMHLPKTLFDFLYHFFGFCLYLSAGITLLIFMTKNDRRSYGYSYEEKMAAAIIGLVNAGLYLFSAILSYRNYRGG